MTDSNHIANAVGEPVVSTPDLALLLGVDLTELRTEIRRQQARLSPGGFKIPADWVRQGRRIAKETQAATGSEYMQDALVYLRQKANTGGHR